MIIIFTDLDGTLLDQSCYSADAASQALELISRLEIPCVFCSSKTGAEVSALRDRLSNRHPFVIENGAALHVPLGYFPMGFDAHIISSGDAVVEFGTRYGDLVETLRQASAESRCRVRGFYDMSVEQVSLACELPLAAARLAKKREYDEPFEILDVRRTRFLLAAIEARGKAWTRGGRFYHITGGNSKDQGVRLLMSSYSLMFGNILSVGLGDGMNDLDFLRVVDIPVIIRSKASRRMKTLLPAARVTKSQGPAGWNRAVLDILNDNEHEYRVRTP